MRTVLLGMNNPQSVDPRHVLYPYPAGCAGARLYEMLFEAWVRDNPTKVWEHPSKMDYLAAFERINLINSVEWSAKWARERAPFVAERLRDRRVIMCGATVAKIVGVHFDNWCNWDIAVGIFDSFEFCVIPHPSGRCREYNDPAMRESVGSLLLEEYRRGATDGA